MWSGRRRVPPSHWLARTSLTSRPRSERAGRGPTPGQEVGCCSARSAIGRAQMRSRWRAGSSPGLRALRGGQAEGPRCWDQSQTQDRRWNGRRAQGSRGQMVPQTLPSLDKPGQAGERLWTRTGLVWPASPGYPPQPPLQRTACDPPAWLRFLDTPTPWEAARPPTPFQDPGSLPDPGREHGPDPDPPGQD